MKSALLIIDVQTGLCTGEWAAFDIDNVVDRINALSGRARLAGIPVVLIQYEEDEGPLRFGTEAWQLYERLAVQPEDIRIRKTGSDSFYRTELHSTLQARGISNLIICGLQSEFCIDSTVRGALALGYPVTLVADAHTTLDNGVLSAAQISAHHNVTLENLGGYGPRVTVTPANGCTSSTKV
ncbi:cysteine hydrolase family protein [Povalibacter sp.]|uniref:cysteine hydrolase family protein n=1 Tax=Povalibacter sp. TaxID=1962978 RepID=UPI002F403441